MYLAVIAVLISILMLCCYRRRNPKLPPGPSWQVPLLGQLPFMGHHLGKSLLEMKKTYGPIFSFGLGSFDCVVISDAKIMKEAFSNLVLCGRPQLHYFGVGTQGKGLMNCDGPASIEQRQFILKSLNDFGFRTKSTEENIQAEISEVTQWLEKDEGKAFTVDGSFGLTVLNAFWSCLTGKRFSNNSLIHLSALVDSVTELPNVFQTISTFVPLLSKLMPNLSGYNAGLKSYRVLHNFLNDEIEAIDKSRTKNHPMNLTEAYLDKVDGTKDEHSSFFAKHNYQPITFGDLIIGAIDTSSTTLAWTLAYLSQELEKQRKLQSEISAIIGDSRLPCLSDRPSMPYTEAVINEILRIASVAPLGIMHRAMEDTYLRNYFIPKDTLIMMNLYGISHDPEVWGDPEVFRPERFIGEDGKYKKCENLIPFGVGRRVCPGEGLARDQLFLYITSIFQKFDVNYHESPPNLEAKFGFIIKPDPFKLVLTGRM